MGNVTELDLEEIERESVSFSRLALNTMIDFVGTVMTVRIPQKAEKYLTNSVSFHS